MGKRARRRKREGTFIAEPGEALRAFPKAAELSEAFWGAETEAAFGSTLEQSPALLKDAYLEALRDAERGDSGIEPLMRVQREVLEQARDDHGAAWEHLALYRAEVDRLEVRVQALTDAVGTADPRTLLENVDGLEPLVAATGMVLILGHLHGLRGQALMRLQSEDRAEAIEGALEELDTARRYTDDDNAAMEYTMQIGIALAERLRGDRAENVDVAVRVLQEAEEAITSATPAELASTVRTNLATVFLRRERGERGANLRRARQMCLKALEDRSPEGGVYDWAHTQLNLAEVLRYIAGEQGQPADDAARAYEDVVGERERFASDDLWLVGAAYFGLGDLARAQATPSAEEQVEAWDDDSDEQEREREQRRNRKLAIRYLEASRRLLADAPDQVQFGRMLTAAGNVYSDLGRRDQALEAGEEARSILRPTMAPDPALQAASLVGGLRSDRGEWVQAAAAYGDALEASELIFQSRLETADREREAGRAAGLARWGAFAMAQAGDLVGAALALDAGRARELHRRTGYQRWDLDAIPNLPDELRQAYLAAAAQLGASPLSADEHAAGRAFQEIVAAIRDFAGDQALGVQFTQADLSNAVTDGWPLVYVNPTLWGTLLLAVEPAADQGVVLRAQCLDSPTAMQVLLYLMAGQAALDGRWDEDGPAASYWAAASGHAGPDVLQRALDEVLPWIGASIASTIAEMLEGKGHPGITLVPCGPIAAVPLHACPWGERGAREALGDRYGVRYAPSGPLAAVAIERAQERREHEPVLVGLADSADNLPAAGPELEEIARHFPGRAHTAVGSDATSGFLSAHIDGATHVHLACHATGSMFDLRESGVALADGLMPATDFTQLGTLGTRLVSISACQSAVVEMRGGPEEVISIGTATIAAGSACAIASLWPVDDRATALLMTKVYEVMLRDRIDPPEALRRAASWLRRLTSDEERRYLREYPVLAAERERVRSEADSSPHPQRDPSSDTPYSHPSFWGGFVAVGA